MISLTLSPHISRSSHIRLEASTDRRQRHRQVGERREILHTSTRRTETHVMKPTTRGTSGSPVPLRTALGLAAGARPATAGPWVHGACPHAAALAAAVRLLESLGPD